MADRMHAAWVNFIKGDAPGGGEIPEWPRYELKGRRVMILDKECRIERDPWGICAKPGEGSSRAPQGLEMGRQN